MYLLLLIIPMIDWPPGAVPIAYHREIHMLVCRTIFIFLLFEPRPKTPKAFQNRYNSCVSQDLQHIFSCFTCNILYLQYFVTVHRNSLSPFLDYAPLIKNAIVPIVLLVSK